MNKLGPPDRLSPRQRRINRNLILRALTDVTFRDALDTNPQAVLGRHMSDSNQHEIRLVLAAVRGMEAQIKALGDELHCLSETPPGRDSPM
jgi:alpha-galactosidase